MPKPAKKRAPKITPDWDKELGILRYGGILVYRRKHSAWAVESIFDHFELEGWAKRIDDPLPPIPGRNEPERLRSQLEAINARLDNPLIRFSMDGTGTGICWTPAENGPPRGKRPA